MRKLILFAAVLLSYSSFAQYHMGLVSDWLPTHSTLAIGIDSNDNTTQLALVSPHANITADDLIGSMEFYSNDAGYSHTPNLCGYIKTQANLSHTDIRSPTFMSFATTADDALAPDTKMILGSSGAMTLKGGTYNAVRTVSANASITNKDRTILADATSSAIVVEVPRADLAISYSTSMGAGIIYIIKKTDASNNNVTIKGPTGASVEFDGASDITLNKPNSSVVIQSDGAEYKILATNVGTDLYSAGTGINITGDLITNTGDLSITNELQNLSATQTGSNVSVNISGGTGASFSVQEPTTVLSSNTAAAVNNRYISNSGTRITVTLPATAAVGDVVYIVGSGSGGWKIAQNSGQTIHGNSDTTPGTGGSLESGARYNCAELRCVAANSDWVIVNSMGTLTFN